MYAVDYSQTNKHSDENARSVLASRNEVASKSIRLKISFYNSSQHLTNGSEAAVPSYQTVQSSELDEQSGQCSVVKVYDRQCSHIKP
jgi:hypothetical protein